MPEKTKQEHISEVRSKAGKIGGRVSSRKGRPCKRSEEARQKVEAMGVDPIQFLCLLVLNKLETDEHPLVTMILDLTTTPPDKEKWNEIRKMARKARREFKANVQTHERRLAAQELLPYLYPKLSHVEIKDDESSSFAQLLREALLGKK